MSQKINEQLIQKYKLDIRVVYFYKNYVVTEIKEGIILNFQKASELFILGKEYYGNKIPFVYTSNRIHSYSFESTAHFKSTKMFPNLKGDAVVTYNTISNEIAEMELAFLNKPVNIFNSLDEAIVWVEQLIISD